MNDENLKKGEATRFKAGEKQARIASKGGKARAAQAAEKKEMRETIRLALDMLAPMRNEDITELLDEWRKEPAKNREKIVSAMMIVAGTPTKEGTAERRLLMDWLGEGKTTTAVEIADPMDTVNAMFEKLRKG